jgi:hypothetical protein
MDGIKPRVDWSTSIRKVLKEERRGQQKYDYDTTVSRQNILRKEYGNPSFAQNCFSQDFAPKMSFM